ncbi:hypothetical protein Tco_0927968 [Tanacetum coccineum]
MDNPNITMEEYIRLEEEKARRHGKVYNWETAKYGKIWYDEDVHDLRSVETEFPAIVFNDELSSEKTLSCEPTVSSLNNNEIDFRVSFDESDNEDYTVSYFDDLDFFKDFENEFPAIVYNDALTSKPDFLTEPTLKPQPIDEFDLKDETSLSEYDEVEQNVLYFNDLFPFNIIYLDNLKYGSSPRDLRHQYLMFEGLQYTNADIADFETRLAKIYRREGLTVIVRDLPVIDMVELVRLQICMELDDTWAWVTPRPERQPDVVPSALEAAQNASVADEGALALPAPVQAPQPPPPAAGPDRTMA